MKIAIFGGTGRVGNEVLNQALAAGHEVVALVRSPEKLTVEDKLTIIKGNVTDVEAVARTISGADLIWLKQ